MARRKSKIDKEIRFRGRLIHLFLPFYTKKKFKFCNGVVKLLFKGKKFSNKFVYSQKNITRQDGTKLRVCIYTRKQKQPKAVGLLWIHGGGYAMGQPEQDFIFIKRFIKAYNCVVIAPEYTKSIEKPYPAALEDCYLSLLWLKENAENLGIDDSKIFVGGDSAGGGLTAALTLFARDKKEVNIAFQMPLYPMINCFQTESSKNNDAPVWNTKSNDIAWKIYLGDLYKTENIPKYASPSLETNYSGLPPTLTFVGDLEPFKDETITYVEDLKKAGVPTAFKLFGGCYHAFDIVNQKSQKAKDATNFLINGFVYACKNYSKEQDK